MTYVYLALRWLFSVLFLIAAIGAATNFPITGVCFLAIALFLLPPVSSLAYSKTGLTLPPNSRLAGVILLLLLTGAVAAHEQAKREARIAAQEEKARAERAAELRQQRIDEFNANRDSIIQSVRQAIDTQQYNDAIKTAKKYLIASDDQLTNLYDEATQAREKQQIKERTENILNTLKTIPVEQYKRNKNLYEKLLHMHPDNQKYQDKVEFYSEKIAQKRREQQQAAARKTRIKEQFSAWDGSHRNLTKVIKRAMNDPDSYEHVETVYWDKGDHLLVRTVFRGKNSFGGVVKNSVTAKVNLDGQVLEIVSQN